MGLNYFAVGCAIFASVIYVAYNWRRPPPEIHFGRTTRIKSGAASQRIKSGNWRPLIFWLIFSVAVIAFVFLMIWYQVIIEFHVYCCGDKPN